MANVGTIPITPADGGLERPLDRGRSRGRALLCGPGPYLPAGERVGAQPAPLHQAAQQPGPREPFEVRARLAAPLAEALYPRPGSASRPGRPARYSSRRGSASAGASPTPAASSSRASASTKMRSRTPWGQRRSRPCARSGRLAARDHLRRGRHRHGAFGFGGQRDQLDHARPIRPRAADRAPPTRTRSQGRPQRPVRLGGRIEHDAGRHPEEHGPGGHAAAEDEKTSRPPETLRESHRDRPELTPGEPSAQAGPRVSGDLRRIHAQHVRDAAGQRSRLMIDYRRRIAPSHLPYAADTLLAGWARCKGPRHI
jgi:hypothetical protein